METTRTDVRPSSPRIQLWGRVRLQPLLSILFPCAPRDVQAHNLFFKTECNRRGRSVAMWVDERREGPARVQRVPCVVDCDIEGRHDEGGGECAAAKTDRAHGGGA